jgi:hypothetical protein
VGSLLVFGSWIGVVPTGLGWIGWLVALAGWGVGNNAPRQDVTKQNRVFSKADEIAKLDLLRKEDIITEEDFQEQKRRLLNQ